MHLRNENIDEILMRVAAELVRKICIRNLDDSATKTTSTLSVLSWTKIHKFIFNFK